MDRANAGDNARVNSFIPGDAWEGVDMVIVAGTPDWGRSNEYLYTEANDRKIPVVFIGIGAESDAHLQEHITQATGEALKRSPLVICRDKKALRHARDHNHQSILLPCPAMFAGWGYGVDNAKKIRGLGIITAGTESVHREAMNLQGDGDIIAHSQFDSTRMSRDGIPHRYHHEPRELCRIISEYRQIIAGKLHGAIPAYGMGASVELLPSVSGRVKRAWEAAKNMPVNMAYDLYMESINRL